MKVKVVFDNENERYKIYNGDTVINTNELTINEIAIDEELSNTSPNAVQNRTVKGALDEANNRLNSYESRLDSIVVNRPIIYSDEINWVEYGSVLNANIRGLPANTMVYMVFPHNSSLTITIYQNGQAIGASIHAGSQDNDNNQVAYFMTPEDFNEANNDYIQLWASTPSEDPTIKELFYTDFTIFYLGDNKELRDARTDGLGITWGMAGDAIRSIMEAVQTGEVNISSLLSWTEVSTSYTGTAETSFNLSTNTVINITIPAYSNITITENGTSETIGDLSAEDTQYLTYTTEVASEYTFTVNSSTAYATLITLVKLSVVVESYLKSYVDTELATKQDSFTLFGGLLTWSGTQLQLLGNVIANDATFNATLPYVSVFRQRLLETYGDYNIQPKLTAGDGIIITDNTISLGSTTYDDVPIPNSKYDACAYAGTGVDQLYRGIKIIHNGGVTNGSIVGVVINDPSYVKDEYVTIKYQLEYYPTDIDLSYYLNLGQGATKLRDGLYELTKTLHITDYTNKTQRRSYVATRSRSHATEDIIVRVKEVKVVNATKEEYENAKLIYDNVQQNGETVTLYMRTDNESYGVEFKNFVDLCTNIKDGSPKKIYNIIFREGTYELYNLLDLTDIQDQVVGKRGCELPNYLNIEGLGNVTIKCTLPDTETASHVRAISTLNMTGWNNIKNINIEITNGRYCIHDDSGLTNNDICIFDNVTMKHNGNTITGWNSHSCYGAGYRQGRNATFKNCIFESDTAPLGVHNTNTMKNPFTLLLENCVFKTNYENSVFFSNVYTSNFKNSITLNNCKLDTNLLLEGSYDVIKLFIGGGNDFTITNTAGNTVYRV